MYGEQRREDVHVASPLIACSAMPDCPASLPAVTHLMRYTKNSATGFLHSRRVAADLRFAARQPDNADLARGARVGAAPGRATRPRPRPRSATAAIRGYSPMPAPMAGTRWTCAAPAPCRIPWQHARCDPVWCAVSPGQCGVGRRSRPAQNHLVFAGHHAYAVTRLQPELEIGRGALRFAARSRPACARTSVPSTPPQA